jgi:hypothetical protein
METDTYDVLLREYGPLMTGETLWNSLGFNNYAAFRQARTAGRLDVIVFALPKRRGLFAHTRDIAKWLDSIEKEEK